LPDDGFADAEDLQTSLEELAATADQLHADNEHLRERIKELTAIMESQMDELVEAERERDLLRQDVSNQLRSPKARLLAPLHSLRTTKRLGRRRG
jgi:regulator of replication initiation timing